MISSIFSMRPTGAFLEPSNYAAHILPLSLLYYMSKGQLTAVTAAALASVVLTFSSWAFIAVGLSLTLFLNNKVGRTLSSSLPLSSSQRYFPTGS